MTTPTNQDHDLLAQYLDGDPDAIAQIRDHARRIVYAKGYFVPVAEREDILQEILLNIYRAASAPGFRLQYGVNAFVRTLAHRRCVDWVRLHCRDDSPARSTEQFAPGPEEEVLNKEKLRYAGHVLEALPSGCRKLIVQRFVEGLSYAEISRLQGRTEPALRNQLYKCLQKAQRLFRNLMATPQDGES